MLHKRTYRVSVFLPSLFLRLSGISQGILLIRFCLLPRSQGGSSEAGLQMGENIIIRACQRSSAANHLLLSTIIHPTSAFFLIRVSKISRHRYVAFRRMMGRRVGIECPHLPVSIPISVSSLSVSNSTNQMPVGLPNWRNTHLIPLGRHAGLVLARHQRR